MSELYIVALAISVVLPAVGIFSRHFDDNFLQRSGLAIISIASVSELYLEFVDASCCQAANAKSLYAIGFAVYGIGTAAKVFRHKES